jgi:hypothetical protein
MSEREVLEREVAAHAARVAEINAALRELQETAGDDGDVPATRARQAGLLRMELHGRAAAIEIGSSRLRFLRD